jgi:hypothetical protein
MESISGFSLQLTIRRAVTRTDRSAPGRLLRPEDIGASAGTVSI